MSPEHSKLLEYYISETNSRLEKIDHKIEILLEHRTALIAKAKTVSMFAALIVSILTSALSWLFK